MGNHSISVKYDDGMSIPVFLNFTVILVPNFELIVNQTIRNKMVIYNNAFSFDHNYTDLFIDPEN